MQQTEALFFLKNDEEILDLPLVQHRNNASFIDSNLLERRNSHVEVLQRQVTPSSIVVGECQILWTEVGRCHLDHCIWHTPPGLITFDLVASAATEAILEKRTAQSHSVCAIARTVEIPVPTRPSLGPGCITPSIERCMRIAPHSISNIFATD
jgi:hypothetical protein